MRIVLSCDLLRQDPAGSGAEAHSAWLWRLLAAPLERLGHRPVLHTAADPATAAALRAAAGGLDPNAAWPLLYSDPGHAEAVRRTCGTALDADLVIGHELSPNQLRVLHAACVPVLDLRIDPARFAPDLFLRARTADPVLAGLLRRHGVADATLAGAVEATRAACRGSGAVPGPALLFAGQTDRDASLIEGARLRSVAPFLDTVRAELEPGWRLLLKPHPYARVNADIRALQDAVPGSLVIADDIYALLCAPAIRSVLTLSSSVAEEARLFGKPARTLLRPDRDTAGPEAAEAAEARITASALLEVLRAWSGAAAPLPRLRLRGAVGQDWGYRPCPSLSRRRIAAGQSLSFGRGGTGTGMCTLGWAPPERDGCWNEGPLALLLLQPDVPGLTLAMRLRPFVPRGHRGLRLTIRGGAGPELTVAFGSRAARWLQVRLPVTPGPVQLELHVTGATSPASHGLSGDARLLGVRLQRARILPRAALATRTRLVARRTAQLVVNLMLFGWGLG